MDLLSEFPLFIDHLHNVFVHGWSQNHIQLISFDTHVTDHLVVWEHTVTIQQAVVIHTLTAQGYLQKKKGDSYLTNIKGLTKLIKKMSWYNIIEIDRLVLR